VADNDKYQNYFLVLKSILPQDNTEVEVTTSIEEVEPKPPAPPVEATPSTPEEPATTTENYSAVNEATATPSPPKTTTRTLLQKPWFWLFVFLLVAGGAYYYYFYIYKKNVTGIAYGVPVTQPLATVNPQQCAFSEKGDLTPSVIDASDIMADVSAPVAATTAAAAITGRGGKKTSSKQNLYNKLSEIA